MVPASIPASRWLTWLPLVIDWELGHIRQVNSVILKLLLVMCASQLSKTDEGKKPEASYSLELELEEFVSHPVLVLRIRLMSCARAANVLNC